MNWNPLLWCSPGPPNHSGRYDLYRRCRCQQDALGDPFRDSVPTTGSLSRSLLRSLAWTSFGSWDLWLRRPWPAPFRLHRFQSFYRHFLQSCPLPRVCSLIVFSHPAFIPPDPRASSPLPTPMTPHPVSPSGWHLVWDSKSSGPQWSHFPPNPAWVASAFEFLHHPSSRGFRNVGVAADTMLFLLSLNFVGSPGPSLTLPVSPGIHFSFFLSPPPSGQAASPPRRLKNVFSAFVSQMLWTRWVLNKCLLLNCNIIPEVGFSWHGKLANCQT